MKLKTLIFGPLMFCVLWFVGWEAYAVWDAREKTEEIFATFRDQGGLPVQWLDLTSEQQDILLKVEDPKFMTHKGVDFETNGAGLTTITQAIAKRLNFEKFTPGFSEIEQSLIAFFVIDPQVTKETQLSTFLNIANFGQHQGSELVGFDPASRVFFGKPPRDLNRFEFIQLVAALISPGTYRPGSSENLKRTSKVEAYLSGKYGPRARRDVFYEHC